MRTLIISILSIFVLSSATMNKSVVGVWKTIDDDSGEAKSQVKIYIKSGKLYGKVIKLYRDASQDQDPICDVCPGYRKDKKIIGMQIIDGLEKDGDEWYKDEGILDPDNGKLYDCKIWLDEDDSDLLHVRGYIGWLFRTQEWHRVK